MSQALNDDDDDGAAADNNNNIINGWRVRMWGDTELFGGLDSCGRAFTMHL
jgi:hypothetical protein